MLEDSFYKFLESYLERVFAGYDDTAIKYLWCDGVIPPEFDHELSQYTVNKERKITLRAFTGRNGQEQYKLVLQLGPKALSRYARGLDIQMCLPGEREQDRFHIDNSNRIIAIQML